MSLVDVFWVLISYSTFDFSFLISIFLDSLTWMGRILDIGRACSCVANCVLCLSVLWRVVLSIFSLDFPAGWLGPLLHSAEPDPLLLSEMWSWVRAGASPSPTKRRPRRAGLGLAGCEEAVLHWRPTRGGLRGLEGIGQCVRMEWSGWSYQGGGGNLVESEEGRLYHQNVLSRPRSVLPPPC